ncbi:hypothetical protein BG015_011877 [Linnemannia schmuckeri]|uniref:Transmembrane protein n=1 Tax=Linnemannia schmuckeri TaxID=64567 RepID=A0A9P5RVG2_9FUNG|nr:hypothetical protein BG015_011877 [Linnemannia schmuckeri]
MVAPNTLRQFRKFMIFFSFINMVLMSIVFAMVTEQTAAAIDFMGVLIILSAVIFFLAYIYSVSGRTSKNADSNLASRSIALLIPAGLLLWYGIRGSSLFFGVYSDCGDDSECHLVASNFIFATLTGCLAIIEMILTCSVSPSQA